MLELMVENLEIFINSPTNSSDIFMLIRNPFNEKFCTNKTVDQIRKRWHNIHQKGKKEKANPAVAARARNPISSEIFFPLIETIMRQRAETAPLHLISSARPELEQDLLQQAGRDGNEVANSSEQNNSANQIPSRRHRAKHRRPQNSEPLPEELKNYLLTWNKIGELIIKSLEEKANEGDFQPPQTVIEDLGSGHQTFEQRRENRRRKINYARRKPPSVSAQSLSG